MIKWELITLEDNGHEVSIDLMASPLSDYSLRETDNIQFRVSVDNEAYIELGCPYVLLGDVPLELDFYQYAGNSRVFVSSEPLNNFSSQFFYNFLVKAKLDLLLKKGNFLSTCTINILARAENAKLASEMLSYITDNLEDAVAICFSRSKISGGHDAADTFNFSRLDIIEKTISYLLESLPIFLREQKHTWKPEMLFSERGQPTGPDSVSWVLSNLDRLSPASATESNLIYNNRSYRLDTLPKEGLIKEYDVFENRVIHTFFT